MPLIVNEAGAGVGGEGGKGFKGGDGGKGGNAAIHDGQVDKLNAGAGGKGGESVGSEQTGGHGGGGGDLQIGTEGYLLAEKRLSGPELGLDEFAETYRLTASVKDKLMEEGYATADAIRWLTVDNAKEMNLKQGEIASLKAALNKWSPVE